MSLQQQFEMIYAQRKQAEKANNKKRIIMHNVILDKGEKSKLYNKNVYVM
ncbi:hypothetical protein M5X02_30170 [Paenibacillus alvei]|nr:hypothetical protein [Paenibacillus alvei]EJW14049.1 hypothetical protein PAV_141p01550 [Paenibacillus alvei DSM 29]MCY9544896.1 hypothetical protein [Paenibacillus alvei]MCY9707797.1 hypothetical protein [Paenibacillus alvei]MEC0082690.1 hypothetical protein [Paenibacillus alvei]